ncbi:zinc-binding dehydrogenase [Goodfellowiella coeruleoviolacea]|uniref:NADPH:quinone reductase n=1 Tax=Goodfellowiella coeruleoviolacea TaxID=334858 RepID=A0AAE3KI23_9PSEU|nr:zinc-binding dehydrogenase [Goodfellowiella coeruleoviolacea]MCP2166999.1 NADPH:quinone reductase [Goodfellowiella coeruleoviolacea]
MRALVVTPDAPSCLALTEVADPAPTPDQVLVEVEHVSLNHGELLLARTGTTAPGVVHGWDAAGVVARTAGNGSGLAVGDRVLTFGTSGAWAQRRAVPVAEVAVVPDGVDLPVAATLPVAGVTALRALRRSGTLLARRVLVTGASGGVGRIAVQLAARAGAHVIASARRTDGLAELGAHQVIANLDDLAPESVDVVVENVGGDQLVRAWRALAPGGVIQSIGYTSGGPAAFPAYTTVGPAKSLTSFYMGPGLGADMAYLLDLVATGALAVHVGWRGPWQRYDEAANALVNREVNGKVVLDVD